MTKIQDEQNINPTYSVEDYYMHGNNKVIETYQLKIENYSLDELRTIRDSLKLTEDIKVAKIKYDYLSGDAFRIGEAINILKLQYDSLDKIYAFLPNLHFEVRYNSGSSDLYITSEFTPRALEPIVGSILKNVYIESLGIHFKTKVLGSEIPVPVVSYIFSTYEEYFSTPDRIDLMEQYGDPNYYSFCLGGNVLTNMGNNLLKYNFGYKMIPLGSGSSAGKELKDFTTQELLEATLITKDLDKSNSILKILPDEIIKKIFFEHVGAQELGLIANRGKLNLYYDKIVKDKFKTIGEKKLVIKQNKELIEQKRLNEKIKQQHSSEVGRLKQEHEEVVQQHRAGVDILKQQHSSKVGRLKQKHEEAELQHSSKVARLNQAHEEAVQKLNANTIDTFSTFMLLNEHLGNEVFQNKNTTYTVELGIAGVLSAIVYKTGISNEYSYLPLVRAGAFIAKDASYSQKESVKQKLSQYLPTESYSDEVDLSLNFVFDTAIAYASPNPYLSFIVSGANSVSNYLETSFGSDYVMTSTNCLSNAIGGGMALLFAWSNEHVLMGANKYPIYSVVSTLLGTKYIYEISNILSAKALDLVGITPENVVEGIEAVKEYEIGRDITTEEAEPIECYYCNDPSKVIDDPFAE